MCTYCCRTETTKNQVKVFFAIGYDDLSVSKALPKR